MNVDAYMNDYDQSSPIVLVKPAFTIVPTGTQDKNLARLVVVEDTGTGAPTAVYIVPGKTTLATNVASVSVSGQLHSIKKKLGLNLSQLSKILNVSRPQLYKWLEGDVIPQRDEFNYKITDIYSLLNVVPYNHGKYFGKLANRYVTDKYTVLDVLMDSELNKDKLLAAYNSIKSDIESIDIRKAKEQAKHSSYNASEVILPPK